MEKKTEEREEMEKLERMMKQLYDKIILISYSITNFNIILNSIANNYNSKEIIIEY